jgi:LuxR family transcriptional regulator, maltose regulon positive regulatory protein
VAGTRVRAARSGRVAPGSEEPLLISKITVPSPPGWIVARPRIDRLIAASMRGSLTLITGPPGAGKTMAITSWAACRPDHRTLAWIALDEHDNRPQVFWSYFLAALRRAGISVPRTWVAGSRGGAGSHAFLLRLASVLASLAQPLVMVIEDVHLLTNVDILDGLAYLLKNATPGLHLVISSRIQPFLPLHQYRLNGEMTEIRAKDLAFTGAESGLLLAQLGVELSAVGIEHLTERTEGWAAGIRLAAITLDGHPDPEQFVKELGSEDSAIACYLVDEVLNAQDPVVRDYLLRTSILERVSADLAAELTGDELAVDTLPSLAAANAFVQPLGQGWYRYHSLFAEILRLKLRREFPGELPDLHRRAASWYLRNGHLTHAVRHAAAAGDWASAAGMVVDELAIAELIDRRGHVSLADEFRCLPEEPAEAQLHLLLVNAAMDASGGTAGSAGASLDLAEGILDSLPASEEIPARLGAALIRIALARQSGELDVAVAASARAEAALAGIAGNQLAQHLAISAQVLLSRGIVELWAGDIDKAATTFAASLAAATAPASLHERTDCLGYLALVAALRGQLSRAEQLAGQAARADESTDDGRTEPAPAARAALAWVYLERNQLRQALAELMLADAALRVRPDTLICALATLILARCRLAEGRAELALKLVSRARLNWSPPPWLERRLTLLESWACSASGDVQAAVAAAGRAKPGSDALVALARARLVAADHEGARETLAVAAAAADDGHEHESIGRWIVDARLSYASGDAAHGRRALGRALQLAKPEQIRLPFAMERSWLRPLLRRDPDLARSYQQLLEPDLVSHRSAVAAAVTNEAPVLVVDRLSQREREVLELLSGMLSTAEIATEMYISVNTVKTHLKSIYRKLSAEHRGEAVRRARQLHLI